MTEILAAAGVRVRGLVEFAAVPEPLETELTFEGNARLKARHYASALGLPCLSDDSGLEVVALGGAPGVLSAYYAGFDGTREERDRANNRKLIEELSRCGDASRVARLICALCLVDVSGRVLFESRGAMVGVIRNEAVGGYGFGYDALLFLPDAGKTAAEMSPAERNLSSHRARASAALARWLQARSEMVSAKVEER